MNAESAFFKANEHRAVKQEFRQFRYIYFVKPSFMRRLKKKVQPYPKHAAKLDGEQPVPTGRRGSSPRGRSNSL